MAQLPPTSKSYARRLIGLCRCPLAAAFFLLNLRAPEYVFDSQDTSVRRVRTVPRTEVSGQGREVVN
jgi:hypothetical protein